MTENIFKGTYEIFVGNYDWGAAVDQVIITLDKPFGGIRSSLFRVTELKMVGDEDLPDHDLMMREFTRKVTQAYYIDDEGEKTEERTCRILLKLYVSPTEGSPFACTGMTQIFVWSDPYELRFSYRGKELSIDPMFTKRTTAADMFAKKSAMTTSGIRYDYAEYIPKEDTDTLFVWLHGLGEGRYYGSDAYLPLLGRKGTTMAGEKFQKMIGYARVIAPQCPTYWMDADGNQSNFNNATIVADGTSWYTDSLDEFIDSYAKDMGAKKIVIAGCSNGGYMSLMLAMKNPQKYVAVIPICEPVPDRTISDETIEKLLEVPMYFVYSKDDPIVPPDVHEIPTIERLKKAGAKDLHVSVTDHVCDTSGVYKDKEGNPYQYLGHLSWIYYDNNETDDGNGLSAWEWLAEKLNK